MKGLINVLAKRMIRLVVVLLTKLGPGRYFINEIINSSMGSLRKIQYNDISLKFAVPNPLNNFRVDTFSTKEPETLEWIDSIPMGAILWDIGANIGLYSCYAAKKRNCEVVAFEPSVFNLELLARNIFCNGLTENITIIPLPLSDSIKRSAFNMTTKEWGGALSTFGESYGDDGKQLNKLFEFTSVSMSMDNATELLHLPKPDYIKLDVDGIEHLILKNGVVILKGVEGVLVEVNEDFKVQADNVKNYLSSSGLILKEKRHAAMLEGDKRSGNTYNQIWIRA